jgi:aminopeptidase N
MYLCVDIQIHQHKMKHFTGFLFTIFSLFSLNSTIAQEPGRSDTLDVLNYGIHLNINDFTNKTIQGYTTIKTTFKQPNITQINFDLLALSVDSIYIGSAKHTNFTYNDSLISIQLATAVTPSDTLDFSIFYHGAPVTDPSTWGGFYYTANTAYNLGCGFQSIPHNFGRVWFPCIDEFRDKAYYDFYITTLGNHMAVCNGTLMDSVTNPNATKTWHWKLSAIIPTYLASVAVGDYSSVNIPLIHGIDTTQAYIYVMPADTTKARNSFVHLNQIFNAYIDHWGPYHWERVGYVGVAFNGGAMEHATNITYPESLIDGGLSAESLYGHELAHSWFGNQITCASAENMWINEGWARYSEALYMGVLHPNADPMLDGYKVQIRDLQYKTFRKAFSDDGGNFALYPMPQNITYGTTTYDKGALIVHTLRNYMGDDKFFNSVRQVLQEYSFKSINSAQFCDRLSFYSGIDLHDFFNAWIYQPGYLHFSVDSLVASPAQNGEYTYYIHQKHSLGNNLGNSNRVEVTFFNQNWASVTDTIHFSGETGSKTVTLPFIPVLTAIDYHERMADAIVDYNLKIKTTGNNSCTNAYASINVVSLEDSAFIRVEHHWAAPDALKSASPAISRLSPNRYWKIDGIAPIDFHAKVNFNFYNATDMDASLLNGAPSDSLIMLYRRNAAEDWRLIPFTKAGTNSGIIKVDTLLFGEYTLAIGDKNQVGMTEVIQDEVSFDINPNPSKEFIQINTNSPSISYYQLINASGKIVLVISCTSTSITVNTSQLAKGVYIVQAQNKLGKTIHSKKMVIANN